MSFIFSTLVESAKLLGFYVLFTLSTAVANPLFPNENSTVAFVSEDEYGVIGSIHYRSPEYRYARVRLMHDEGPELDVSDGVVFEIWIETDLDGGPLTRLQQEIKQTIKTSFGRDGIALNEAKVLGQAVGIDEVRSAGADFDRRIRSQLNELARNAGGGTVISTGPFTEAFEGQYNLQLDIKYDPVTSRLSNGFHISRGFARASSGISGENLAELANFIDGLVDQDEFSVKTLNNILAASLKAENSPYGDRLKRTGNRYCPN